MNQQEVAIIAHDSDALAGEIHAMLKNRFRTHVLHIDLELDACRENVSRIASAEQSVDAAVCVASIRDDETESWIEVIHNSLSDTPILLLTPTQNQEDIVSLLKLGISDFIIPPVNPVELVTRLQRIIGWRPRGDDLVVRLKQTFGLRQLVGQSASFRATIARIPLLARCDATALIEGETGTGKELFARAIHYLSARSDRPFVPVNCAALPLELFENELFGHEADAYTGARGTQHGLVEAAAGGTLFLDEIDSLSSLAQVKLLRLLQEKEYRPLGSTRARTVDLRLLAATNTDIREAVLAGRIREDFYYRLNVLSLRLPPLRERPGDVQHLAEHFCRQFAQRLQQPVPGFSRSAMDLLVGHHWPGNVRELEHVIERAFVQADGQQVIRSSDLQLPFASRAENQSFRHAKAQAVARWERSYIENLLAACGGNISQAARTAKKNRRAFWELIRKHRINAASFRVDRSDSAEQVR